jgi:hypothetical protein
LVEQNKKWCLGAADSALLHHRRERKTFKGRKRFFFACFPSFSALFWRNLSREDL